MHLKALALHLNCWETGGCPGFGHLYSYVREKHVYFPYHPSKWEKSSSEGNVCSLPQAVWDLSGLYWAGSYSSSTCCAFFFGNVFGEGAAFLPGSSSPTSMNFEHHKAAVEWLQRCVSLLAPPLTHALRLTRSHCSWSVGSAIASGQRAVPGRAVVLMLLLSVLFYTHFVVVLLPIHTICS